MQKTLELALDVILPDGDFPGHHATGVISGLERRFLQHTAGRRMFDAVVTTLDRLAQGKGKATFVRLDEAERREVILEADTMRLPPYRLLRNEAMQLHYSDPAAWRPLRFVHAPQPLGHLDYASPPRLG